MTMQKAIARAWTDPAFKARLVDDPTAALAEVGIQSPDGKRVNILENTADTLYLVIPLAPPASDGISADDLEKIAAGAGGQQTMGMGCASFGC